MAPVLSIAGFAFDGIGYDTSKPAGAVFYFGDHAPASSSLFEWVHALVEEPESVSSSVNPFTGETSTSAFSPSLSASDRVATLFMSDQRRPDLLLDSEVGAGATTARVVDLEGVGVSGLTGRVVYVGDETMLLGATAGEAATYNVTRGFFTSPVQAHPAGSGVFERVPGWEDRQVRLVEQTIDASASPVAFTETVRWRGVVDDIRMVGPTLTVDASELLARLATSEVNTGAKNLAPNYSTLGQGDDLPVTIEGFSTYAPSVPGPTPSIIADAFFQVDDQLVRIDHDTRGELLTLASSDVLFGSEATAAIGERGAPKLVTEVFAVAYDADDPFFELNGRTGFSSLRTLIPDPSLAFHPLAIALALLTSTGLGYNGNYDVLGSTWGLGIDFLDFQPWLDAIAAEPGLRVDRLVLGWGASSVNVLGVVQDKLLRPFGFYLARKADGLIGLGRLRLPEIPDYDAASAVSPYDDEELELSRALRERSDTVVAIVGELPFREGQRLTIREPARSSRAARLSSQVRHEYDMSVFDPSRLGDVTQGGDPLASSLVSLLAVGLDSAPRLACRVADHVVTGAQPYDLGRLVTLSDLGSIENAWLVDADGNRVQPGSSLEAFAGFIVSTNFSFTDHSNELVLLLLAFRAGAPIRLRAPAAQLSVDGGGSALLELDTTGPYGDSPGLAFSVGDEVALWTQDGIQLNAGAHYEVTARTSTSLSLSAPPTTAPVGAVVRLATSTVYSNAGVSSSNERAYAFIAEGGAPPTLLATPPGPDKWGTRSSQPSTQRAPTETTFIGLDEDLTDAVAGAGQPMGAYVDYALRGRESYLVQDGHQVSWVPESANAGDLSASAGHRPYASAEFTTALMIPWVVEPGLSEVRAAIVCRVATESPAPFDKPPVFAQFGLGQSVTQFEIGNTEGVSPQFTDVQLVHRLDAVRTERGFAHVRLRFRSQGSSGSQSDDRYLEEGGIFIRPTVSTDGGFLTVNPTLARPAPLGGDTEAVTYDTIASKGDGAPVDWLYRDSDDYLLGSTITLNAGVAALRRNVDSPSTIQRVDLSYIQLKGAEFSQRLSDTTYPSDLSMRPGEPVLGEVAMTHALRTRLAHKRARCLWIGPTGDRPGLGSVPVWPDGYTRRWARLDGDAPAQAVFEASCWLHTSNPKVIVLVNALPYYKAQLTSLGLTRDVYVDAVAKAEWDFWLVVDQIDGAGGFAAATTLLDGSTDKQAREVLHYPTPTSPEAPALSSELATDQRNEWSFKEGQLYPEDEALVQTLAFSADVPFDPAARGALPVRLRLFAERSSADYEPGIPGFDAETLLTLMAVGISVWEDPS